VCCRSSFFDLLATVVRFGNYSSCKNVDNATKAAGSEIQRVRRHVRVIYGEEFERPHGQKEICFCTVQHVTLKSDTWLGVFTHLHVDAGRGGPPRAPELDEVRHTPWNKTQTFIFLRFYYLFFTRQKTSKNFIAGMQPIKHETRLLRPRKLNSSGLYIRRVFVLAQDKF
jgi:hypothetical protein